MNLNNIKGMVESMGTSIDPDGDWLPCLFLESALIPDGDGDKGNIIIALIGFMQGDEETEVARKDLAAGAISLLISQTQPETACFITTAWKGAPVLKEEFDYENYIRPSKDPNREEVVMCFCVGRKGESDGETIMLGYIQRSDGPPRISKWEIMDEEGESEGRFAKAMYEGFAMIGRE